MESSQNPEGTNVQVLSAVEKIHASVEKMQIEGQETRTLIMSLVQAVSTLKSDVEGLKYDSMKAKLHNSRAEAQNAVMKNDLRRIEEKTERLEKTVIELHQDSLEAINMLSTKTDDQFRELQGEVDAQFRQTRNEMASKDHLDRKVDGLEVGISNHIVRVDEKDTALVVSLLKKGIVDPSEKEEIIAMSPFPVHG